MAPVHSEPELCQAPSTQLPPWTTVIVIVRVARLDDSIVPVHVPATLTKAPAGGVGPDDEKDEPHPLCPATMASPNSQRADNLTVRRHLFPAAVHTLSYWRASRQNTRRRPSTTRRMTSFIVPPGLSVSFSEDSSVWRSLMVPRAGAWGWL
jgi:hypothetical protein